LTLYFILSIQNTHVKCVQRFPNSAPFDYQTFWKLLTVDMQWPWCDWLLTETRDATVTGFSLLYNFLIDHTRTVVLTSELGLRATAHRGPWWLQQSLVCERRNILGVDGYDSAWFVKSQTGSLWFRYRSGTVLF